MAKKYHKKPKGTDAHQHVAGEDWSAAEPWIQEWIADGRLVIAEGGAVSFVAAGVAQPVQPTDWIVSEAGLMSNAQFTDTYDETAIAGSGG